MLNGNANPQLDNGNCNLVDAPRFIVEGNERCPMLDWLDLCSPSRDRRVPSLPLSPADRKSSVSWWRWRRSLPAPAPSRQSLAWAKLRQERTQTIWRSECPTHARTHPSNTTIIHPSNPSNICVFTCIGRFIFFIFSFFSQHDLQTVQ